MNALPRKPGQDTGPRHFSLPRDPHAFESIGSILRGMRAEAESRMTTVFDPLLSMRLDFLLALEQHDAEGGDD